MKIVIFDKQLRHNLALFKHLIHRQAQKIDKFSQTIKSYKAFIHKKTGELYFAELEEEKAPGADWQEITIQLRPNKEGAFEVVSATNALAFECDKLQKTAYQLLVKTLHTLNDLCYDPKHGTNPFWVLRQIADIDFLIEEEDEHHHHILFDSFHRIDRLEAEQLLLPSPVGSYLFRKDMYTKLLEEELNENFPIPIQCLTLSYLSAKQNVSEKIVVYKEEKWAFYNNDPNLLEKGFNTIKELLQALDPRLSSPLLRA